MKPLRYSLATTALSAAVAGLFSQSALAVETAPTPLKNLLRGDAQCLAWQAGGDTVAFAACDGSAAQDWTVSAYDGGNMMIRNRAAAERNEDRCLRTFPDGNAGRVALGTCKGDGYTSMRMWQPQNGIDGRLTLRNKYRGDLGRTEMLTASADTASVAMRAAAIDAPASTFTYPLPLPLPTRPVKGEKSALLLVSHFDDSKPADADVVRGAVFGSGDDYSSLRRYVDVASHGKLQLHGETLAAVNLGARPATCDSGTLRAAATKAALARGVDPAKFDYLLIDLPKMSTCNWGGLASMPGNWILSNASGHGFWMWTHEFGHNLGASHARSLVDCPTPGGTVEVGGACKAGKIDDPSDTMGGGGRRLYPASYQHFAGWLGDADVPEIRNEGTYRLAPLWGGAPGAKAYRMARADGTTLWLEFRQPLPGFDDWKADDPFVNGVIVRTVKHNGNSLTNTLVDTTPGSANGMKDAPLMPGHALHDTLSGKIVTVKSVGPDGAVVDVKNDGLLLPQAVVTGPQQADAGAAVTLSGASSVGTGLTHAWTVPAGVDAKPNGVELRFAAPMRDTARDYAFDLTVTNDKGYTSKATHVVNVKAQEIVPPPQAKISGPATADGGANVTLSGAASTGKGLKHAWAAPAGVSLVQNGASATFVAPKAAAERRYTFRLTVTDAQGRQAEATHDVTVHASMTGGVAAWDPKKTYATPCQEVSHAGKTWLNGWWVLGDVPGTGGEWGAWREKGAKNQHWQCRS
ncbi:PKD domain-containing protein [Burkholderia metallica]|uniref:PKD domain-containing protein n=1 Tax=Burkholderia metallica TaxID=488729 RepID=UPI001F5BF1F9|nr:carbohydrate-binding protein [Burkholderia metallica]